MKRYKVRGDRAAFAIVLASVLAVSACSDSSDDDDAPSAENPSEPADGSPPVGSGDVPGDLAHGSTELPAGVEAQAVFSPIGRDQAGALEDDLGAIYEVVENHGPDANLDCLAAGAGFGGCSLTNLHVKDAAGVLAEPGARLYFHSIRRVLQANSDQFTVNFVNGDLHYLETRADFAGAGEPVSTVSLVVEYNQLAETDFMPRYWAVSASGDVQLLPNTDSEDSPRDYAVPITGDNRCAANCPDDTLPIASSATRHAKNEPVAAQTEALAPADVQARIIPQPTDVTVGAGTLDISGGFSFAGTELSETGQAALALRQAQFMESAAGTPLTATIDAGLTAGSYTLDVTDSGISIVGSDDEALFYGAQSLLALVQPGNATIPQVSVNDSPRFEFRGMHIDVARNFHSVETVKRLIDQMSAYKMNKLHLHMSDDEGWRLEIPGLPELTTVGGRRAFQLDDEGQISENEGLMPQLGSGPSDDNPGSGFFTRADYIDLLQYANARYIEVIPAFDMPGHARAAVMSMRVHAANQGMADDTAVRIDDPADTSRYLTIQNYDDGLLNPCIPGTYSFLETVVGEVKAMHDEAGAPLDIWHMGGDEANNIFLGAGFTGDFAGSVDPEEYDEPWAGSPACEQFIADTDGVDSVEQLSGEFVKRVSQIVATAGIDGLYAYQDIYGEDLAAADLATTTSGVDFWRVIQGGGYADLAPLVDRGFDTVMAAPDFLYFDFPQEVHPEERGYYWATRLTDTQKVFSFAPENLPQNAETSLTKAGTAWEATGENAATTLTGMQGQLWSETVRTAGQVDYHAFPRLIALAERAWHRAGWELDYVQGQTYSDSTGLVDKAALDADFALFAAALGTKELPKLDAAGVQYRIPVPGAELQGGQLDMNVAYPGLGLQYATDADDWQSWDAAAPPVGATRVRATSTDGERAGRAAPIE